MDLLHRSLQHNHQYRRQCCPRVVRNPSFLDRPVQESTIDARLFGNPLERDDAALAPSVRRIMAKPSQQSHDLGRAHEGHREIARWFGVNGHGRSFRADCVQRRSTTTNPPRRRAHGRQAAGAVRPCAAVVLWDTREAVLRQMRHLSPSYKELAQLAHWRKIDRSCSTCAGLFAPVFQGGALVGLQSVAHWPTSTNSRSLRWSSRRLVTFNAPVSIHVFRSDFTRFKTGALSRSKSSTSATAFPTHCGDVELLRHSPSETCF